MEERIYKEIIFLYIFFTYYVKPIKVFSLRQGSNGGCRLEDKIKNLE